MGMLRRRRFGDLIERQLDLFAEENVDLLREIDEHRARWRRAAAGDAEEAFGDEQDRVDWAADALSDLYHRYAATLDDETEILYGSELRRAVRRRFHALADAFDALTEPE